MNRSRALAAAAIAAPLAFMGLLLGFLMLFGAGSESTGGTASCGSGSPSAAGEPPLIQYYIAAASKYHLGSDGYAYLAAINSVETTFGTNLAVSSAGAVGWMQFEPATFAQYGVSVTDPNATADASDPQDAIYTAARYLHASGAPANWEEAIFAYNHSQAYVDEVEGDAVRYSGPQGLTNLQADIAAAWGNQQQPQWSTPAQVTTPMTESVSYVRASVEEGTCSPATAGDDVTPVNGSVAVIMPNGLARPGSDAPASVQAMVDSGDRITSLPYSYGGGHCVTAMNQTVPDPNACPGEEENGGPGFDCSSSTSYLLWGGGYADLLGDQPETSGQLEDVGMAGSDPKSWVTWWANAGHVFMLVDGIVMDTVHGPTTQAPKGAPRTGPRWQAASEVHWELTNDTNVGTFVARHLAGKI
jgi:hypothetical protein